MRKLLVAQSAGFCFGVSRAVRMAREAAPAYTLGPLIHNRFALEELRRAGVEQLDSPEQLPRGATLILRSHGSPQTLYAELESRGITYLDAVCPYVARIHALVEQKEREGRHIFILGDATHAETKTTAARCREATVFGSAEELSALLGAPGFDRDKPLFVVAQTTSKRSVWEECVNIFKKVCTNAEKVDTICNATTRRQEEAASLSRRVNAMVVVGDPSSANTRALCEVCVSPVTLVESAAQLPWDKLRDADLVGVTAGASTPRSLIEEVVSTMTEEMGNNVANEEIIPVEPIEETAAEPVAEAASEPVAAAEPIAEPVAVPEPPSGEPVSDEEQSFAEMLEQSLKTLNTGDKVTGVITGCSATEVHVDLGTKHAAYIPLAELTDEPNAKIEDLIKIGEEIETFVMRVNDVDGVVMLSKRRLDTIKGWEDVEQACEDKAIVEGYVKEENKGGIVVSVNGVRVFVPASQTGVPKDVPMSSLIKQKVRLRITEFHKQRRRVVGSIRSVQQEERRALAEQLWDTIEVGNHYEGEVKSLTSYGAFVDIGGVDGLVHLSELSWQRLKSPADMLKVGDKLDVHVIAVDKEKKRISLGHRKAEDNPWNQFLAQFGIGDVAKVRIVKLMAFGAFAEVLPGVDGLIHISQLSDHRIAKPADAVSEGDVVDVKITDIDLERQKISLSIRALIEREPVGEEEDYAPDNGPDEIVAIADGETTLVAGDLAEEADIDEGVEEAAAAEVEEPAPAEEATAAEEA